MALVIDEDKCARCGVCEPECPNEAIFQTEDAYVIDSALCNECVRFDEPQCVSVCSNDGIHKPQKSLLEKCMSLFG
jgi:ferredoxin